MELDFSRDVIEKFLLKRILNDKNWTNIISHIYEALFGSKKKNKTIFQDENISIIVKLVLSYYEKYNSCPNNKLIQLLAKKFNENHIDKQIDLTTVNDILSDLSNMNYNIDDEILNSNLKEFIKRQAFYESINKNLDKLTTSPDSYENVVNECLLNFEKVQKITFNDTDLGLNYFDEQAMKQHWDFIKNPEAKINTGWKALDSYTNGGFLKDGRMLALIMAQAGLGKSVFLSNMAVNFLKQNLNVVVISLEMSQDVYAQRFDAHISQKNINQLRENEDTAVKRIKEFYKRYPSSNLIIKEYPPRSIRTNDINAYLENLKNNGYKIDVIIVDYLNLVLPNHSTDSMYKDGLSVSEELRALSYKYHCPVISATQCNSEGMNSETIDMQNVSESRGIVHTTDFLAALMQSPDDRENGIIQMRLLKNRLGGQVGKLCQFQMDPETLTVADITFDNNIIEENGISELGSLLKNQNNITSDISNI